MIACQKLSKIVAAELVQDADSMKLHYNKCLRDHIFFDLSLPKDMIHSWCFVLPDFSCAFVEELPSGMPKCTL